MSTCIYYQKPVMVEAIFLDDVCRAVEFLEGHYGVVGQNFIVVSTCEGPIKATVGKHYLVRDPKTNRCWPVSKESFAMLFEAAS